MTSLRALLPLLLLSVGACAGGTVEPRADTGPAPTDVAPQQDAVTVTDSGFDAGTVDVPVEPDDVPPVPTDNGLCRVNNDGTIARNELAFLVGASVLYVVNDTGTTVEPVDTAGIAHLDRAGERLWTFTAPVAADRRVLDEVISPVGRWWASSYSDATFATVVDRSTNLLGVYRVTETALELLGTVSSEQGRTNLRLSPPVQILRFPLQVGETWEQTVTGAGFVNLTPLTNTNRYTTRVDARGEVRTPAGRFPALRIRTDLSQSVGLFTKTVRTYAWVSECWGVVARIISTDNESAVEFRRASEYRRLGL